MKYADPVLVDHLASAYVLGTLGGPARRRFERLLRDRADVRLAVTLWESRLGELARSVPRQEPPARVWAAIEARTRPALATAPAQATRPGAGWPGWLRPAGLGLGGMATGLITATVLFLSVPGLFLSNDQMAMRSGERLPQSYVGLLTDAQGQGKLLVSSLRHGKTLTLKVIGPITPPEAGHLVLWAVPATGAPFVLGPVPATGTAVSMLPDTSENLLARVSRLVVTAETATAPAAPGPPVLSGNCAKLW